MIYKAVEVEQTIYACDDKEVEQIVIDFLVKERAILKLRLGYFKECFDICINQCNKDISFA